MTDTVVTSGSLVSPNPAPVPLPVDLASAIAVCQNAANTAAALLVDIGVLQSAAEQYFANVNTNIIVTAIASSSPQQQQAIATLLLAALQRTIPAAAGVAWNDGGSISLS